MERLFNPSSNSRSPQVFGVRHVYVTENNHDDGAQKVRVESVLVYTFVESAEFVLLYVPRQCAPGCLTPLPPVRIESPNKEAVVSVKLFGFSTPLIALHFAFAQSVSCIVLQLFCVHSF